MDVVVKSVVDTVVSCTELSELEQEMIVNAVELLRSPIPDSKTKMIKTIDEFLVAKSNLNYLMTKLKQLRATINSPYRKEVENKMMILVRQGRPSKDAIYSEIHSLSPALQESRDKLESIDRALELLAFQLNLIDSKTRNIDNFMYELQ